MPEEIKSIHQTLEQTRARAAWKLVREAEGQGKDIFEKYEGLVKKFPAMINFNGLGQSIAFLFSKKKGDNAEGLLLNHLEKWLILSDLNKDEHYFACPYPEEMNSLKLLEAIQLNNSARYFLATQEALSFINYLRRFAAGLLKENVGPKEALGETS